MGFFLPFMLAAGSGVLDFLGTSAGNRATRAGALASLRQTRLRQAEETSARTAEYQRDRASFDVIVGHADASGQAFTDILMGLAADAAGDVAAIDANANAEALAIKERANASMRNPIVSLGASAVSAFAAGVSLQAGVKELGGWSKVLGVG